MLGEIIKNHKSLATAEQIELGIRFFDHKDEFGKSTNFRVVANPTKCIDKFKGACHADMKGWHDGPGVNRALIATDNAGVRLYKSDTERQDLHGKYLNWLTKESFFAPFFLSSDDFHFESGFIISSDIPTEIVQFMLLGTRAFYECTPKGFGIFNDLYDKYGGDVAALIVTGSNLSLWGPALPGYSYEGHLTNGDDIIVMPRTFHNMQSIPSYKRVLDKYLARDTAEFGGKNYRKRAAVFGSSTMFGEYYHSKTFFGEFVESDEGLKNEIIKSRKLPVDVVRNPFARPAAFGLPLPSTTQFRWSEIRDIILPEMQTRGYFNV